MLWIEINRNSPAERSSRYTQILKSRKQEVVHHLVLSRYRLDKLRMCVDVIDQTICVLAHLEEVSLLLRWLYLTSAVRALAVHKL